jgi:hypothetical protein
MPLAGEHFDFGNCSHFTPLGGNPQDYATGGYMSSSPAVANGVVYVGSGGNKVYALKGKHRHQAVELHHRVQFGVLACGGEWDGVCRLGRSQRVRLRPEDGSEVTTA